MNILFMLKLLPPRVLLAFGTGGYLPPDFNFLHFTIHTFPPTFCDLFSNILLPLFLLINNWSICFGPATTSRQVFSRSTTPISPSFQPLISTPYRCQLKYQALTSWFSHTNLYFVLISLLSLFLSVQFILYAFILPIDQVRGQFL